mmetsp:Transcript_18880/g.29536  ORF Transcript_18880/g.29536 Transcript_18880/m.29536 type:complete len:198 (-) Transcript_18880:1154-1747(-)
MAAAAAEQQNKAESRNKGAKVEASPPPEKVKKQASSEKGKAESARVSSKEGKQDQAKTASTTNVSSTGKRKASDSVQSLAQAPTGVKVPKAKMVKVPGGIQYEESMMGKGKLVKSGTKVVVQLQRQGKRKAEGPERQNQFMVGLRQVAWGLDRVVVGMREGGQRIVHLAPEANDAAVAHGFPTGQALSLQVTIKKAS